MTPLPQVNCTLTSVNGGGVSHDYRQPDAPLPKWTGESGAFVDDRLVSMLDRNGDLNRIQKITLYVDADLPMDPPARPGDTVVYTYQGIVYQAKIQNLSSPRLAGVPSYSTLALEHIDAA